MQLRYNITGARALIVTSAQRELRSPAVPIAGLADGTLRAMQNERAADSSNRVGWHHALIRRFPEMTPDAVQALAAQSRRCALRRGEPLLRPGEYWEKAIWVEAGALRLYYVDSLGEEWNKNFHLEGSFVWPLTPWLRNTPVSFCIEAIESVTAWTIHMQALEAAVGETSSWIRTRLDAMSFLLEDKMRREQIFLQQDARQRYATLLAEHPDWPMRIPQRHLASYLGMTDVSLSRLRARMRLIKG